MVIAIVAVLASLLLPALRTARDTAKTASCVSNAKQLAIYFTQYASDYNDCLPPSPFGIEPDGGSGGWDYQIWNVWLSHLYTSQSFDIYQSAKGAFKCPMRDSGSGFGYNTSLAKVNTARIRRPMITRLVADWAFCHLTPFSYTWDYAFRHGMGTRANILCCDGHVERVNQTEFFNNTAYPSSP